VVIAQDFESSAVWGMPGAVANAGICSELLSPEQIAPSLQKLAGGKIS
jgi:two-component system chemotaxis response regulator CheB